MNRASTENGSLGARKFESSFLLDIAHCFRNRAVQYWGVKEFGRYGRGQLVDGKFLQTINSAELVVAESSDMHASAEDQDGLLSPDVNIHNRDISDLIPAPRISAGCV
jgi:hypothetical protein